jgi:hypothetical protein
MDFFSFDHHYYLSFLLRAEAVHLVIASTFTFILFGSVFTLYAFVIKEKSLYLEDEFSCNSLF